MTQFQCCRCSHAGRYSTWVLARWLSENTVHRCERCGTPHTVRSDRAPEALGPVLLPFGKGAKYSPWYDKRHRPWQPGMYQCEFTGGIRLLLRWNGAAWTWCSKPVDMRSHIKWRGDW